MNRPDDPKYYNKELFTELFPNHICGQQIDEECGRCIWLQEEKMNHVHSAENKEGVCDICDSLKETEERRNRPYENEFEQWIHENIMKDCWHNLVYDAFKKMDSCTKCGTSVTYMWGGSRAGVNNYRYTTSLDAAAEVEKKTIKSTGRINLRKALMDVIAEDLALEFKGSFPAGLIVEEATFATAEQRARACKSAWESRVCKSA